MVPVGGGHIFLKLASTTFLPAFQHHSTKETQFKQLTKKNSITSQASSGRSRVLTFFTIEDHIWLQSARNVCNMTTRSNWGPAFHTGANHI